VKDRFVGPVVPYRNALHALMPSNIFRICIRQNANETSGSGAHVARLHRGADPARKWPPDRPDAVGHACTPPRLPSLNLNWECSVGFIIRAEKKILGWSLE
jgi:hypothetical protein